MGAINVRAQDITPLVDQLEPLSATPQGERRSTSSTLTGPTSGSPEKEHSPEWPRIFFSGGRDSRRQRSIPDAQHAGFGRSRQVSPDSTRVSTGAGESGRIAINSRQDQPTLAAQPSSIDRSSQVWPRSARVSPGAGKSGCAALGSRAGALKSGRQQASLDAP